MQRKPIFDIVRQLVRRSLTQSEVDQLDRAIDVALADQPGPDLPAMPHAIGPAGIALIQHFEGCARIRPDGMVAAYPDPGTGGDPWTIGWGTTGAGIGPGVVWTQAQCDARLERDLGRYAAQVAAAIGDAPTNQAQFDAMVSFHYNTGAIGKATLTRLHIKGDYAAAAGQFALWNKAAGRVLNGLTRRRKAEAELYRNGHTAS